MKLPDPLQQKYLYFFFQPLGVAEGGKEGGGGRRGACGETSHEEGGAEESVQLQRASNANLQSAVESWLLICCDK